MHSKKELESSALDKKNDFYIPLPSLSSSYVDRLKE